ncbi:MAG: CRISPR system precrRNA processing endoribonuclease RAMP protein Cas6 [Desulfuromusa sp.]|nr:CRISPR system precrRNA processing endoribonuclease RAMP protein Cas6 [Desulfuromusa sp.]
MQFGKYDFKCTFRKDAILPEYKGSTFRGGFGVALKKVSCTVRHGECDKCLLAQRCLYARTFEISAGQQITGRMVQPPRPYIIQPPPEDKRHYAAGDCFDFNLILFGETNEYLPYFIYAFEEMGKVGLGKKIAGRRATYTLDAVKYQQETIYQSREKLLTADQRGIDLQLESPGTQATAGKLELMLNTPLRLKQDNHLQAQLPFDVLVRAMLRRISSLFEAYGDGEPQLDYRGLVAKAKKIEVCRDALHWFDWQRYSNRQEAKMLMGGMTGSIVYRGNFAEYLPLLKLSQQLHIGKQTAFGLGQIDYRWISA